MATRQLFVFGPPRLEHAGPPIGLRKAVALLVYLAVTGQPHSRDILAALLWPRDTQRQARANLRGALHRIRHALGDLLLAVHGDVIQLQPHADLWVDVVEFEKRAAVGLDAPRGNELVGLEQLTHLEAAAALYTGGFLDGFSLPDSPTWDEWQFFRHENLHRTYLQVLERIVHSYLANGLLEKALDHARQWATADPLHEPAHRILMRLYTSLGRQDAALRQYRECARLLEEELGVPPEEETTALYESIQKHNPSSSHPRVHLPGQPTPFLDRERELLVLERLLVDDGCHLLTILGPGGIGKTRLALEVATVLQEVFRHGAHFVPLSTLAAPAQLAPAIAEHIGFRFFSLDSPVQQLVDYLSEKEMLLVLDNYESILEDVGLVEQILLAAPRVRLLTTSRERLNLSSETVYTLGSMQFPRASADPRALEYGAVQLLIHRARLVRPDLDLRALDLDAIVRICQLVQGMPLALVLAAGWAGILSFREIAAEIEQNLDFLEGEMHDMPPRQQSVRATFDYSWERLAVTERETFMRLTIFHGGFTWKAARAVARADLRALRALADHSFLSPGRGQRYQIHELLRQYGEQHLAQSGHDCSVRDAHATYYLDFLHSCEANLKGRAQLAAAEAIDAELENIRAAWKWALFRSDYAPVDRAVESLYLFFTVRSRYQEGAELLRLAEDALTTAAGEDPLPIWGRVATRLAFLRLLSAPVDAAAGKTLQRSLAIARRHDNQPEVAFTLLIRGCYHFLSARDSRRALPYFERSLAYYSAVDDAFYTGASLHWLGECYGSTVNLHRFREYTLEGLQLTRRTGNLLGAALNLGNLVTVSLCAGDYLAAEHYCDEALEAYHRLNYHLGLAWATSRLALLHLLRGDIEQCGTLARECYESAREVNYTPVVAHALAVLAVHAVLAGEAALAFDLAETSLTRKANAFEDILGRWALALAHCATGEVESAWCQLQVALRQVNALAFTGVLAWLLPVAAVVFAARGQSCRAVELLGLAYAHPNSPTGWMEHWTVLTTLRDDLEHRLGHEQYCAAWARGERLDLARCAAALLDLPLEEPRAG
jgi:predicted ATPase/DNA-binding SARP family transcriptional activator